MVCHAFRKAGGRQATFVGGGALAVEVERNCSFFPNVYNEDWFYMLNAEKRLQSVATVGEVLQYPYDPTCQTGPGWRSSATCSPRAPSGCSTKGRQSRTAILRTRRDFLEERRRFIEQVRAMVGTSAAIEPGEQRRMAVALTATPAAFVASPRSCAWTTCKPGPPTRAGGSVTFKASRASRTSPGKLRSGHWRVRAGHRWPGAPVSTARYRSLRPGRVGLAL